MSPNDVISNVTVSANAYKVLEKRYLAKDEKGTVIETPTELFKRVAWNIAQAERNYSMDVSVFESAYHAFYRAMSNLDFLPNSPTLMNAGRELQQLSACFVLPVEDSMTGIFDAIKNAAIIHKTGGGTGFAFSRLRPNGDFVKTTGGVASGPISFLKVFNQATEAVKQGGTRRGANMAILRVDHPDILEFIKCKDNTKDITNFNISVAITDTFMTAVENDTEYGLMNPKNGEIVKTLRAREVFDTIAKQAHKNGEPGLFFIDRANATNPVKHIGMIEATNPCITGDTLVYVADGRGNVPIKELAEKDEDVPVFCLSDSEVLVIRWMRHPRITGYNQKIFKVTLDDGNALRVTENHKFRLKSGEYKEVKDLQSGDSLYLLTKFEAPLEEIFKQSNLNSQEYCWLNGSQKTMILEHRLIAEFFYNNGIPKGYVVHHKDFNAKNNNPDNLQVMTKIDHDYLHSNMIGENNPMARAKYEWSEEKWARYKERQRKAHSGEKNANWSGVTDQQLKEHALFLTKQINRRFTWLEWIEYAKKNNLPAQIDRGWRKNHLGGIIGLAKWAAFELGFEHIDADSRTVRAYKKYSEQGYDCEIIDNQLFVNKHCEYCFAKFLTLYWHREKAFCSISCSNFKRYENPIFIKKQKESFYKTIQKKQLEIYSNLKFELGRAPSEKEWEESCKKEKIPYMIDKKGSTLFKSYNDLKENAVSFNHKVSSVEFCGYENVYNGTVDEYHNFFIGGFECEEKNGKKRLGYINNLQCGEQELINNDVCNLGSINLENHLIEKDGTTLIDWSKLEDTVETAVRFLDNIIDMNNYPLPDIEKMAKGNRRIGLGIMGFARMLYRLDIPYNSVQGFETAETVMRFIQEVGHMVSLNLATERGEYSNWEGSEHYKKNLRMRNSYVTTIAPTGTISMIADTSSGCEPEFSLIWYKNVMDGQHLPYVQEYFIEVAKKEGFWSDKLMDKILANHGSVQGLQEVPEKWQKVFVTSHDISSSDHVRMQACFQKYVDSAVSKTINMANTATVEDVKVAYRLAYQLKCKGITVYRDGSRDEQVMNLGVSEKKENKSNGSGTAPSVNGNGNHIHVTELLQIKPRAEIMKGGTVRKETSCGHLYLTINEDDTGDPFEVFANMGKAGGCEGSQNEATARLISLCLRAGVDYHEIVKQLIGIRCNKPFGFGPTKVESCADATAKMLYDYMAKVKNKEAKEIKNRSKITAVCPECECELELSEGCEKCRFCGYSRCG